MANPSAPFGFRPWTHGSGGTPGRLTEYPLSTAYATALYYGDLVLLSAGGDVNIAAAGNQVVGVFAGVNYYAADGSVVYKKHWTAATAEQTGSTIKALVYDDPQQLFLAQSAGSMTRADVGQFCDVDTSSGGSASTGISGQQTSATGGSETTFKIVDVVDVNKQYPCRNAAGNQDFYATGTNALVVVRAVKHVHNGIATTEV